MKIYLSLIASLCTTVLMGMQDADMRTPLLAKSNVVQQVHSGIGWRIQEYFKQTQITYVLLRAKLSTTKTLFENEILYRNVKNLKDLYFDQLFKAVCHLFDEGRLTYRFDEKIAGEQQKIALYNHIVRTQGQRLNSRVNIAMRSEPSFAGIFNTSEMLKQYGDEVVSTIIHWLVDLEVLMTSEPGQSYDYYLKRIHPDLEEYYKKQDDAQSEAKKSQANMQDNDDAYTALQRSLVTMAAFAELNCERSMLEFVEIPTAHGLQNVWYRDVADLILKKNGYDEKDENLILNKIAQLADSISNQVYQKRNLSIKVSTTLTTLAEELRRFKQAQLHEILTSCVDMRNIYQDLFAWCTDNKKIDEMNDQELKELDVIMRKAKLAMGNRVSGDKEFRRQKFQDGLEKVFQEKDTREISGAFLRKLIGSTDKQSWLLNEVHSWLIDHDKNCTKLRQRPFPYLLITGGVVASVAVIVAIIMTIVRR